MTPDPREHLIVALDVPSAADALRMVDRLDGQALWYKVGLELYLAAGPAIVQTLAARGLRVFLDLKLHDIPNTVAAAVRALAQSGASLLTVHAVGGPVMLRAAAQAAAMAVDGPRLLAVTVLTSMDQTQLTATGVDGEPLDQVLRLAQLARAAGIDGMVCSPEEVAAVRGLTPDSLLVVPGIRPAGTAAGDQMRLATPAQGIAAGASMLVVGRPITQAADPGKALAAILTEISSSHSSHTAR